MDFNLILVKLKRKMKGIKKVPVVIVKHAGFVSVLLVLISFFIGSIIFYKYGYIVINKEVEAENEIVSLDEKLYQEVINKWEEKENKREKIKQKTYPNPFTESKISEKPATSSDEEPQLTEKEKEDLLANPAIQSLLEADNLFDFYTTKENEFLSIDERAQIWGQLNLGEKEEYEGGYYQNIKLLTELKKELTK